MASAGTSSAEVVKLIAEGTPSVLVPASTPILTFSGLPSGVTATAGALSGTGPWTSTITLHGSNTAVKTTTPAVVTVTSTAVDAGGNFYVNTAAFTLALILSTPTLTIAPAASGGTWSPAVAQGGSTTDVFSITTGGSFNAPVALSVAGLPSGVTASWTTNPAIPTYTSGTGTVNSTLTLTASPTAPATASPVSITVTAAGNSLTATPATKVSLSVTYAPAVQVTLAPAAATVDSATTGLSGSKGYQVTTVTVKGVGTGVATTGAALSISGLPAGMTGGFNPSTVSSTGVSKLTLTGGNTVTPGPYTVTITASQNGGAVTGAATLNLQVTQTAATLAISPTTATMALGVSGTASQAYTLTGTGFYTGSVTMAVLSGLPAHVTASWSNPNPAPMTYSAATVNSTSSSTLTLTADSSAVVNATPVTVTITATGDGIVQTSIIRLTITGSAGLTVSPNAPAVSLTVPGNSTPNTVTDLITLTGSASFPSTDTVTLSAAVAGSPTGVTATMCSGAVTLAGNTKTCNLTLSVDQTASGGGPYAVTITATGTDGIAHTGMVNLTVNPPGTLTVSAPAAATVYIPMSATSPSTEAVMAVTNTVSVTTGGGFSGNVTLTASGMPTGVTASWSTGGTTSTTVTPSGNAASSVLALTAATNASAGTSTITITASGGGVAPPTAQIGLTVRHAAMYVNTGMVGSPLSVSGGANQGVQQMRVWCEPPLTGTDNVTWTLSGLPAGVSGGPFTNPCAIGSVASSEMTLTPTPGVTPTSGTATVIFKGTAGSYSASYTYNLTLTP